MMANQDKNKIEVDTLKDFKLKKYYKKIFTLAIPKLIVIFERNIRLYSLIKELAPMGSKKIDRWENLFSIEYGGIRYKANLKYLPNPEEIVLFEFLKNEGRGMDLKDKEEIIRLLIRRILNDRYASYVYYETYYLLAGYKKDKFIFFRSHSFKWHDFPRREIMDEMVEKVMNILEEIQRKIDKVKAKMKLKSKSNNKENKELRDELKKLLEERRKYHNLLNGVLLLNFIFSSVIRFYV